MYKVNQLSKFKRGVLEMLYAIVDEDLKIARHISKGKLAVFEDLKQLNKNAWRYMEHSKKYKVGELEFCAFFELDKKEHNYQRLGQGY